MQTLRDLQAWYLAQCYGDWEHGFGINIGNLDNPGWRVEIDLAGTTLEGQEFVETTYGLENPPSLKFLPDGRVDVNDPNFAAAQEFGDDPNWLVCSVKNKRFEGYGGPEKLEEILAIFLNWANSEPTGRNRRI